MTQTLYLDKDTREVYAKASGHYESFTPTIPVKVGEKRFLVIVGHTTYDSESEDTEVRHEVIDAYVSADQAHTVAELIHKNALANPYGGDPTLVIPLADGTNYPSGRYLPWVGWGNRFKWAMVIRFTIDEPRVTVYGEM